MTAGIDGMFMATDFLTKRMNKDFLFAHRRGYPQEVKKKPLAFMKKCPPFAYSSGNIVDCVTGKETNVPGTLCKDPNGIWYWASHHVYYLESYDLALDEAFIRYVMERS